MEKKLLTDNQMESLNMLYRMLLKTRDEDGGLSIKHVADQIKDAFSDEEVEALVKELIK